MKKLILSLVLAVMPVVAQAGQITQTQYFGGSPPGTAPGSDLPLDKTLNFNGFDSTLGTLNSV